MLPLCLLCVEAYDQYRTLRQQDDDFPYKPVFLCLIAVAFWNLFGAGFLGFLINLPVISYFQMGTWLTASHAHGALMGVYGMLSIAMMLFVLRGTITDVYWQRTRRLVQYSMGALNVGLLGMIVAVLIPVGYLQLHQSVAGGFWSARTRAFYETPLVHDLLWIRIVPDLLFISGAAALAVFLVGSLLHIKKQSAEVITLAPPEPSQASATRKAAWRP